MLPSVLQALLAHFEVLVGWFVPATCRRHPDDTRRARLIAHFGLQGTIFGAAYATFYAIIRHHDVGRTEPLAG